MIKIHLKLTASLASPLYKSQPKKIIPNKIDYNFIVKFYAQVINIPEIKSRLKYYILV